MRVLVACEYSGRVRDAFIARGHDAISCDLLPSDTPGPHYQGDVIDLFDRQWDMVIAFPPCTDLSLAGARFWKAKQADGRQQAAARFFMDMVNAPAKRVAVENPRGIMTKLYRPPDQVVEPWWFGDPFRKKTCLWLRGLPLLEADHTLDDYPELTRAASGGGSWRTDKGLTTAVSGGTGTNRTSWYEDSEGRKNRAKVRSRTFPGVARAMADQWSNVL